MNFIESQITIQNSWIIILLYSIVSFALLLYMCIWKESAGK